MIILWAATHIHGLTHGRGLGGMTLPLEISQIAFIGLYLVLSRIPKGQKTKDKTVS